MTKQNILILFGGASSEHEVSVMSAASVIKAIDKEMYNIVAAGITPEGYFELMDDQVMVNQPDWPGFTEPRFTHQEGRATLLVSPGEGRIYAKRDNQLERLHVDAVFPVLHGPFGEDGRLQGLLEMCGLPYVGAGVLSSALSMDKGIAKRLFQQAGFEQTPYLETRISHPKTDLKTFMLQVELELGFPVFVKPANLGSSVGISKAANCDELENALQYAAVYDRKVLVEQAVNAREIECAVLGSHDPQASLPAEVLPSRDFYDYEDKYFSGASRTQTPADLSPEQQEHVRQTALNVYQLLECQGLARVDFFLDRDTGRLLVNEVNTMPGFTKISLYPKMWEVSGLTYTHLIHRLIQDAFLKQTQYEGVPTSVE
ncbi:MAG: D-alanine--D-alanine ligase family protein [Bacillota bacterium]|nr:D-alanine--D-alanine ligase family protein [Bacillota bacterium]MDW7676616.1 D-alanine--D-alanine ligase family protein [Bacillota bacterium]